MLLRHDLEFLQIMEIVAICIIENCIYVLIWKNLKYLCINKYFDFQENYEFESLLELLKFIVELIPKSKYLYIINILEFWKLYVFRFLNY